MKVLDLFSGIGGFSLGLERTGMKTVAFCEIEPFCRAVLRKHWPDVPIYEDVRTLTAERLHSDGIVPDVICGGFPCQDISMAGRGAGIEGERSGLWSEYARIIGEVRPRYVIVENVAALLGRGLERVLGDLAALGFDAEWHCIPASAIGAPHRRDRLWLVAYGNCEGALQPAWGERDGGMGAFVRDEALGNSNGARLEISQAHQNRQSINATTPIERAGHGIPDPHGEPTQRFAITWSECGQWLTEPDVGRMAHGVSARVDRLKGLGNAVVPQIPEIIGRAIMGAAS